MITSNQVVVPSGLRPLWESITPNTPIHAYTDKVGVSTIGWGSTYYDNIMSGKKPVKMGDTITKKKADEVLDTNVAALAETYSKKMKYWKRMRRNRKLVSCHSVTMPPMAPIGSYRNLTDALNRGDMVRAAKESHRGVLLLSPTFCREETDTLCPKDLTKVSDPLPITAPEPPSQLTLKGLPYKGSVTSLVICSVVPKRNRWVV